MVIGNLWNITDPAMDATILRIIYNWLPAPQEMEEENPDATALDVMDPSKYEPELLCALERNDNSCEHYMITAALAAWGLPVVINGKQTTASGRAGTGKLSHFINFK